MKYPHRNSEASEVDAISFILPRSAIKNLRSAFINGVAWSLADKLVNQIGYLGVTLYLARLIGPESFGLVGMLTIFVLLAESTVNNGFSQALIQKSHLVTEDDASTVFYINLAWAMGIYALLFALAPVISDFYNEPDLTDLSRVLFLVIIINSLSVVSKAKLTIRVDFRSQTIAGAFSVVVSSALSIYLAQNGFGVWALVYLLLCKSFLLNVGLIYLCRWRPRLIFSTQSFKDLFKFGSNLIVAGFGANFLNNLYVVLIGRYFNAASVGYFTQANNISVFSSNFVTSVLQSVTYPIMTSIKDDQQRLVKVYKLLVSSTLLVTLPLLIGIAAIADSFVLLFLGEEWLPAVPVLVALSLARAFTPISAVNMIILNAIGRSDLFLKVDVVKYPIVLVGFFVGILYGIEGVAWSMVCMSGLAFFINAYFPGKFFGLGGMQQIRIGKKYLISAVMMYAIVRLIHYDDLIVELILKVLFGAFSYIFFLVLLQDALVVRLYRELSERISARKRYN